MNNNYPLLFISLPEATLENKHTVCACVCVVMMFSYRAKWLTAKCFKVRVEVVMVWFWVVFFFPTLFPLSALRSEPHCPFVNVTGAPTNKFPFRRHSSQCPSFLFYLVLFFLLMLRAECAKLKLEWHQSLKMFLVADPDWPCGASVHGGGGVGDFEVQVRIVLC